MQRISSKQDPNAIKQSVIGNFVLQSVAKAIDKSSLELEGVTEKWQRREISNVNICDDSADVIGQHADHDLLV